MLKKASSGIKELILRSVNLRSVLERLMTILLVSAVLALGWFTFLNLVSKPPIEPTTVLIMIWLSVFVLLLALFPKLLSSIKALKFKDFEIDLQDTVTGASMKDYASLPESSESAFTQKGNSQSLPEIIRLAAGHPDRPILLVVNLRGDDYISIPMLFIYLFFFELIGKSVTVLLISAWENRSDIGGINTDSVLGAVSGKTMLKEFYINYPKLYGIFGSVPDLQHAVEHFLQIRYRDPEEDKNIFDRIYGRLREYFYGENEYLTIGTVRKIFGRELGYRTIDLTAGVKCCGGIADALAQGNEYILLVERKILKSIIPLSKIARDLSLKIVSRM